MENLKIYTELSKVDCSGHIEKKGGLNYLSWVFATDYLERFCEEHGFSLDMGKLETETPEQVKKTGFVNTFVTINGKRKAMWLPVMDYRNRAIENPTATDINTAYMRCLTKNIATRWGLGCYIYFGMDELPQEEKPKVELISDSVWKDLNKAYNKEQIKEMYKELGITKGSDIPMEYAKAKIDAFLKDNSNMPVKEFY